MTINRSEFDNHAYHEMLCLDLDGTLVATDTLDECLLGLLRHQPHKLLMVPVWLLFGKAGFKERVAASAADLIGPLPYRDCVRTFVSSHLTRSEVVLATAANWRIAERVASECEFITRVLASDNTTNLSGRAKLARIQELADGRPFDYIGDHRKDIPIWKAAGRAIVVGHRNWLEGMADGTLEVTHISSGPAPTVRDWLRQVRVHQWSKNLLLGLPLVLAHQWSSLPALIACVVAIVAFSCFASAVYLVNDLIDLPHDRTHPTKRNRPLARGVLTIRQAAVVAVALGGVALILSALLLNSTFILMLLGYGAMSLAYSLWLKRIAILDVLLLAGFYVHRVLIGAVAIQVPVSFWLLAFSLFFFLSLGIVKRFSELVQASGTEQGAIAGRGYTTADIDFFRTWGLASGCISVLVMALYLRSTEVTRLYARPELLWLVCPLAFYWIMRVWLIADRGQMPDDPIVFALRDSASYFVGALMGLLILAASI